MTTFTTEDRIIAEKDGSYTANVEGGTITMNKPVAWIREDGVVAFHEKKEVDSQGFKWFALYTHSVKELTDNEIQELIDYVAEKPTDEDLYDFAKAILKKAQEK
jgi:hypothetical protein